MQELTVEQNKEIGTLIDRLYEICTGKSLTVTLSVFTNILPPNLIAAGVNIEAAFKPVFDSVFNSISDTITVAMQQCAAELAKPEIQQQISQSLLSQIKKVN